MKKIVRVLVAVLLMVSLVACGSSGDNKSEGSSQMPQQSNSQNGAENSGNDMENPKETDDPQDQKEETIEEQVLVDERGIKITAKELSKDGMFGEELKLLIENNSDQALTTQVRAVSVNGYMVETMMSADVAAGKKSNDSITFMESDFEACGITEIADIEFYFHIFTSEEWDEYLDTELIQIKTSIAERYEYTYDDSGEELYNENGIRIVSKGVSAEESIFGPGLVLYIENLTEQSITVQSRDSSVNGFMIESMLSEEVSAGKRAVTAMTFFDSDLEENDISEITDLEFYFHIFTTDDWDTIADTDIISVSV